MTPARFPQALFGKWNRNHFLVARAGLWCKKWFCIMRGPALRLSPIQCVRGPASSLVPTCRSALSIVSKGFAV
jgi:hypothetical protein